MNPLCVKVTEFNTTFPSIPSRNPFPATDHGTSTNNEQDGDNIGAYCFSASDKISIQAWFGSYVFTDKSGKTASCLLKLWRLQVGICVKCEWVNYNNVGGKARVR